MTSDLVDVIKQICNEKNISYEAVIATIESALAAAYRKDYGNKQQNIKVNFEPSTGTMEVFDVKEVVDDELFTEYEKLKEERQKAEARPDSLSAATPPAPTAGAGEAETEEVRRFNPKTMIPLSEAQKIDSQVKVGAELKIKLEPPQGYGRMAAQTAKQVIIQKLREAERETIYNEYKGQEGMVVNGLIQRVEGRLVLVDLGRVTAVLPQSEQPTGEHYHPGQRLRVLIKSVEKSNKGAEVVVSRSDPEILKKLFEIEVPEVQAGSVVIKSVAREAGLRSKIAVVSTEENVDPIGSCVGQRGTRVQTVINELGGEKIDIIEYDDSPQVYIANALAPAKVTQVEVKTEKRYAKAYVKEDQLSLAIGKAGQNVRLAAKLTNWKIDIVKADTGEVVIPEEASAESSQEVAQQESSQPTQTDTETGREDVKGNQAIPTDLPNKTDTNRQETQAVVSVSNDSAALSKSKTEANQPSEAKTEKVTAPNSS